jgi:metal-dependent amidase/aminoacylase/carboxypeptidase family protein
MVQIRSLVAAAAAVAAVSAAPTTHQKRIAQTIADSTTAWVAACQKAGGAGQCNTISQTAFTTLLVRAFRPFNFT